MRLQYWHERSRIGLMQSKLDWNNHNRMNHGSKNASVEQWNNLSSLVLLMLLCLATLR